MEQIEVKPNDTLVGISVRENVPVATLRRLNKLYGNEVYPGMLLKLRSPLPNKTATDASGNAVPKPTSFASSFRMATKPHDSGKSQPPSSSLLSAAKGPSIFFFGSSSSSGSSGNSSGHDKCNSSSSNLTDGISTNSTSSSGSNNTLRDSSKQTLSSVPPVVVNGYFDNPPGSESPAGKSARSRAASIESTPPGLPHTSPSFPSPFQHNHAHIHSPFLAHNCLMLSFPLFPHLPLVNSPLIHSLTFSFLTLVQYSLVIIKYYV